MSRETVKECYLLRSWLEEELPHVLEEFNIRKGAYRKEKALLKLTEGREEEAFSILEAAFRRGEEVVAHPLDEAIAWVKDQGENYSHGVSDCVVKHFTSTDEPFVVSDFARRFNVSYFNAYNLYFGDFCKISPYFENFYRLGDVKAENVIAALEFLKRKKD